MNWQPLTSDDVFDNSTLEIACDGEYIYIRDRTFTKHMLPIPILNWGGPFAGRGVGSAPESRSDVWPPEESPGYAASLGLDLIGDYISDRLRRGDSRDIEGRTDLF